MPTIRGVLTWVAIAVLAACSDSNNLPDPTEESIVDTLDVGSLTDTPLTTPSGFAVTSARPIRTDQDPGFDFAYDIDENGQSVLIPRAALGITSGGTAEPGLMRRDETFNAITEAPSNGYVTDEPVPISVGERYIVRSRVTCALAVPYYAKIEIISLENNFVSLQVLANVNCGYRGLEPGLPDR